MGRKYTLKEWRETTNPRNAIGIVLKRSLSIIGAGFPGIRHFFYAHSRSVYTGCTTAIFRRIKTQAVNTAIPLQDGMTRNLTPHQLDFIRETITDIEKNYRIAGFQQCQTRI